MYEKLKRKYTSLTRKNMKNLKVYKPEYETIIDIYSGLLAEYSLLTQKLVESGFDIEVETQRGGTRKSAIATAHEKLRTDIILYSDRLMLNPKMIIGAKLKAADKESQLSKALAFLDQ